MFENKKILILGFARSGYDAAKFLIKRNNEVIVTDQKEIYNEKYEELKQLGVKFEMGNTKEELLNESIDYLIKSPGVPIDHEYVLKAKKLGIEVINEVEMAYRLIREKHKIKLIAVTGSNGKTTTTTLIYNILKQQKNNVHLAGNIGYPLSGFIDKIKENDILVMEISCQQLENLTEFKPDIAVMTNITEAHIDFMKTYEHYKYVKSKLLQNQTKEDIAIINKESKDLLEITQNAKSTKKYYSKNQIIKGCYIKEDAIYYYDEKIIDLKDIKLRGAHNYENIMAAIMATKELKSTNEEIKKVLTTFMGVEHRLEYVNTVNKRTFYNDTEATNIKCTQIALSSFKEPTIIILGGLERGQNFDDLKPYIKNVKAILAIGECRKRVVEFAKKNHKQVYEYEHLKDATKKAYEISDENDIILLSPASASWDQYKQCEDRGDEFKNIVNNL